jgi:hypothetical protein
VQSDKLSYVGRTFKNKFSNWLDKKIKKRHYTKGKLNAMTKLIKKVDQHEVAPPPQKKG